MQYTIRLRRRSLERQRGSSSMTHDALTPVTILTGFLGSGKTTVLKHVLGAAHGQRIAVIENELGEVGIDGDLLLDATGAEIVEMANGCICCTVRADLTRFLEELNERRTRGEVSFERVVIETTGVADPAPVAQTFFVEPGIVRAYRLDGVVTLVDAVHGERTLDEHPQAARQVGFADRLLLTKTDLVAEGAARELTERLMRINVRASVARVLHGAVDLADVLDLGGFELDGALGVDPYSVHHAHHAHRDDVTSFVWLGKRALDLEKVEEFLGSAIDRYGDDLLRYKGVLDIAGRAERIVLQGVQRLVGCDSGAVWDDSTQRASTIVFIGRNLPRALLASGLEECAA